jgi:hypothetical protein
MAWDNIRENINSLAMLCSTEEGIDEICES